MPLDAPARPVAAHRPPGARTSLCCTIVTMTLETWSILAVGVIVIGSHWSLHRDIADLRERMAKLEGTIEGFMRGQPHVG